MPVRLSGKKNLVYNTSRSILWMNDELKELSLSDAAERFLLTLPVPERGTSRQEIHKFVSWFGAQHAISGLTGAEVAHYADRVSLSHADYDGKLERVRAFLAYTKKEGWTKNNLAANLKPRKGSNRRVSPVRVARGPAEALHLTQQGYTELEAELETLKSKRPALIDEIQRAAADKDFRENVPLHAAREARGHLEGRIMELEKMLKSAVIVDGHNRSALRVNVGDSVVICHVDSGEERRYTLVGPREVNPALGRISSASPIGKAVVNREQGETVEVVAPAGKTCYRIKLIER